ncbi:hypothetical protein D3C84_393090 [compost metagenome]
MSSDGHFNRNASHAHSATLNAEKPSNSGACRCGGANRNTSVTTANAHQAAPHTSNNSERRPKLNASNALACWPNCKRQAPIMAARPNTMGVQNPLWPNGCKPSLSRGPSNPGAAIRNATPPVTCNNKPKTKLTRCCKYRLNQMINRPLAAHTALAVCHGKTNSTARLISTNPASNTSDKPRSKRTSLRTMSSRAANNMPPINARPINEAVISPLQPAPSTAVESSLAPCRRSRNNTPPSSCTANAANRNVRDCRRRPTNKVTRPANAQLIAVPWVKKNSGASR